MAVETALRVACAQVPVDVDCVHTAYSAVPDAVGAAAQAGAALVVLPELVNSGYHFVDADEAWNLAEPVPGPWTTMLCNLSVVHSIVIVAGLAERGDDGKLYSSSVIVDAGDIVGRFRKAHLWDAEHRCFTPGDQPTLIVNTSIGRIATAVCYDIEFPEMVRTAAEHDAIVLTVPVNWPLRSGPDGALPGGWPIEAHKVVAHAADYRIPVAVADRCGAERGMEFTGGSIIVGHDGVPLAGPHIARPAQPALLIADLVAEGRSAARWLNDHNHALNDRRPDLYPGQTGSHI